MTVALHHLGAIVNAEPAGEKPVPVSHLDPVIGGSPAQAKGPGHHLRPDLMSFRVSTHRHLAGGPGRAWIRTTSSMGTAKGRKDNSPQVLLGGEGKVRQIVQAPDIPGLIPASSIF